MGHLRLALLALCAGAAAVATAADKLYRWVDEDGVVHYGDSIPPEHADKDGAVLNPSGIQVGTIEGAKTPEERAEEARQQAAAAERAERARLDRALLDTYTTVEEIELLRDRRLELLDARTRVTEQYLENLRARLARLETQSARFRGSEDDSGAALPEKLAEDMIQTMTSIGEYEQRLADSRRKRAELYRQFEAEITRYRELKGLGPAPDGAAATTGPASKSPGT